MPLFALERDHVSRICRPAPRPVVPARPVVPYGHGHGHPGSSVHGADTAGWGAL